MMDVQFYPIKTNTNNARMAVNTISRDDNDPVIKHYIRTIKDRSISVW